MGGPYFFGSEGWKLVPEHFAERHGLIVIIALGESIVAIGVGAAGALSLGIAAAAVLGVALTAAMWWIYFDVVAIVSARRLAEAEPGRVQNEMARDSYSYLHLPMVAGIVLVALGLKKTIGHFDDHLDTVPAFALLGGARRSTCSATSPSATATSTRSTASACCWRSCSCSWSRWRPRCPRSPPSPSPTSLIWAMIAYETRSYGEGRRQVRRPQGEAA